MVRVYSRIRKQLIDFIVYYYYYYYYYHEEGRATTKMRSVFVVRIRQNFRPILTNWKLKHTSVILLSKPTWWWHIKKINKWSSQPYGLDLRTIFHLSAIRAELPFHEVSFMNPSFYLVSSSLSGFQEIIPGADSEPVNIKDDSTIACYMLPHYHRSCNDRYSD